MHNQHTLQCSEVVENAKYPSKYWRTPTYAEMNYLLNTRTNASNLRTLGRVEIISGTYRNGLFLMPDDFVVPSGITVTITTANFITNSYTLAQFKQLESVGVVFIAVDGSRENANVIRLNRFIYWLGTQQSANLMYALTLGVTLTSINLQTWNPLTGLGVRLIHNGTHFSTSTTTKIDFAPANLQYHCTQHIWRFAEHSYDIIGADNANISDNYDGWIDLFGYGTSGVNYSPTLHSTNNADYASGDITNTDNDWGVNEIESYDYNVSSNKLCKTGVVGHNKFEELYEYPSKYWRTPTYNEMNYLLNTRTNASNLRTLGRVNVNGTYVNGCFLLPDDWVLPTGLTMTITTANYTTNSYSLEDFGKLEENGAIFLCNCGYRDGSTFSLTGLQLEVSYYLGNQSDYGIDYCWFFRLNSSYVECSRYFQKKRGIPVRLCRESSQSHSFSTSATSAIQFAPANLQYHCTQHKWRFAEHSYDILGAANVNISDTYNGWIDLFGYGTSGVTYSPTLTSTNNSSYPSGDITNTDNDWGINRILTYEQNSNLSLGLYKDTIITNNITEN